MHTDSKREDFKFAAATEKHYKKIINKLNDLRDLNGVGVNYHPYESTDKFAFRFGDTHKDTEYLVLKPQDVKAVRAYMDSKDSAQENPEFTKVRKLFQRADEALVRAQDYISAEEVTLKTKPAKAPKASIV